MESLFEKLNGVSIINGLKIEAKSQMNLLPLLKKKHVILYALFFYFLHVVSLVWQKS